MLVCALNNDFDNAEAISVQTELVDLLVNLRKNELENPIEGSGSLQRRLDEFLDDVGALLISRKLANLAFESLPDKVLVES
jgi:hypothetical protein